MNELHLFAGAGGGILGGQLLGHTCVCAVEWEPYAQSVLVARQNDGTLPPFPIWNDVQSFDGKPWRGRVDVVAGGFPCQDISVAGKGAGLDGARSGMWGHMARVVGEVRPRFVFVENSPALVNRGLGRVLGDLSALGYDSRWIVMGAADVGANHKRDRLWILAYSRGERHELTKHEVCAGRNASEFGGEDVAHANGVRELQPQGGEQDQRGWPCDCGSDVADADSHQRTGRRQSFPSSMPKGWDGCADFWSVEPAVGRMAHGVAHRVDRLKAIGNGQVPQCAATAFRYLMSKI